uniref:Uncharacterized protein n=1 Tax=Physcomitrium patens TaxID=3218 RepID=A0A7I4DHE2_PHYPA
MYLNSQGLMLNLQAAILCLSGDIDDEQTLSVLDPVVASPGDGVSIVYVNMYVAKIYPFLNETPWLQPYKFESVVTLTNMSYSTKAGRLDYFPAARDYCRCRRNSVEGRTSNARMQEGFVVIQGYVLVWLGTACVDGTISIEQCLAVVAFFLSNVNTQRHRI